jgi:hypothetical protein
VLPPLVGGIEWVLPPLVGGIEWVLPPLVGGIEWVLPPLVELLNVRYLCKWMVLHVSSCTFIALFSSNA